MENRPIFYYFTKAQLDMFNFYRLPKLLITSKYFKTLSSDAKILYSLVLDRMSLSLKNRWFDKEKRAYIYFSIDEVGELLNCGKNKAVKTMQELEDIGLIEKKRQGMGKPNILYVKSFEIGNGEENVEDTKNVTNGDSIIPENSILDVYKEKCNYTEYNYNKCNKNNKINHIDSIEDEDIDSNFKNYTALVKKNIEYDLLLQRNPYDCELLEGIFELIVETLLTKSNQILIASNKYPSELVKTKFLKLNCTHVEYVLACFKANTSKVHNIKKYLLAALFNAPATISGFYQAEVNHDMNVIS